ncbi:MAG: thioredoxin-disulfide reductase [Methylocystis sp.]|jgi:thioredoxin reductase (NADPH)
MPPAAAPRHSRVIVLGSGPAGYTAAIYAARAMLEPVLIAGFEQGGQLMITTDVENYPGFAEPIQGPWLMDQMRAQAEHVGTKLVSDHIVEARLGRRPFELLGDSGQLYTCDALIIATGAKARWLGLPSEEEFKGFGVSACATCDGFFFRNKRVIVVGGGNTAVEEAIYLSNIAAHVTLVHRRDTLRSERVLQERLRQRPNVEILFDHGIDEILGDADPRGVTHVRARNTRTGAFSRIPADGVFVAIGHSPASELFRDQLTLKPSGYIVVEPGTTRTNIPGVFAAGDVADEIYRQAVTAAGLGCMAALEVEKYLMDAPTSA